MEKPNILIIDDDSGMRKTLSDILRIKGYETLVASEGAQGLSLLEQRPVSVVLIDLGLPDIPGVEVLERVKKAHPITEAIILTGNATFNSAIAATNRGAFAYMMKPYEIDQMLLLVRRAIEKRQAEEKILRRNLELQEINTELRALYEVSQAISRTLDLDELIEGVLRTIVKTKILPFEIHGGIFLAEEGKGCFVSFFSLSGAAIHPCREIRMGECFCGQALESAEILVSRNTLEEGRHALCHPDFEPRGRIAIPLKAVGTVVGLLTLYTPPGTELSEGLLKLLSSLGSQIGIAISNARLYEETKSFSLHDPLTGLANRRFLQVQLEKSFERSRRYNEPLSLVMLDVDRFKVFNDTYGHPEGDRLLVELSEILLREVRRADYVFRYGGEEFLLLLPGTDPPEACRVAERLREAVEAETDVTISLGVSTAWQSFDKESLVREADEALYRAKKNGRNRVEKAGDPPQPARPPHRRGGSAEEYPG